MFKPEFLNRIDDIIVFHALNKENMKKITAILLRELSGRCQKQLGLSLKIRDSVKTHLVETAYDEKYGARPLKRAIQTQIEDALADELLAGRVKRDGEAVVTVRKGKIAFDF